MKPIRHCELPTGTILTFSSTAATRDETFVLKLLRGTRNNYNARWVNVLEGDDRLVTTDNHLYLCVLRPDTPPVSGVMRAFTQALPTIEPGAIAYIIEGRDGGPVSGYQIETIEVELPG